MMVFVIRNRELLLQITTFHGIRKLEETLEDIGNKWPHIAAGHYMGC